MKTENTLEAKTENKSLAERFFAEMFGTIKGSSVKQRILVWLKQQPESKQPTWQLTQILMRLEAEGLPMPDSTSKDYCYWHCENYNVKYSYKRQLIGLFSHMDGWKNFEPKDLDQAILKLKQLLGGEDERN